MTRTMPRLRPAGEQTVQDLIWRHAQLRPDAAAVIAADGAPVTYRELTGRADAIAARLARFEVRPDQIVGIGYPRGVDGLAAMLGVLRAGAALLYLDPAWPAQRLAYMTAVCGVRIVLDHRHGAQFPQPVPTLGPPTPAAAGPLTYVVFTSGSTGIPKGVLVEEPGVRNMAVELARAFTVGAGTRVLQFAAWAWDAAMCEILMTFCAGGTLVLAPDEARDGGPALADVLRRHAVEVVTLTPSLLDALPTADLPALRTVVSVGEPCHPALVRRWTAPHRRVFNGYGPTETTVAATIASCTPGTDVHIGTPLPGVLVQVVDHHNRPTTVGAVGELLVGGIGVARGYAADPAMTAARFTTDARGQRWYRTGDLVARRPDGALTYIGRTDTQIKIRGHRIELGEIEHVIAEHPRVRSCAVTVVADQLIAYVVPADPAVSDGGEPDDAATSALVEAMVLQHARQRLTAFAVPAAVHAVARMPLTAHGKVDRDALTARAAATLTGDRPTPSLAADAASDSLPHVMQVVSDVLGLPVDADTDFIEAGGHSLLVAQLCVALSETLGREVPYVTVAVHRTPAGLATAIDQLNPPHGTLTPSGGASSTPH